MQSDFNDLVEQVFQSTHPVRGATTCLSKWPSCVRFQSTHPVRGATFTWGMRAAKRRFQSTHPVRGATGDSLNTRKNQDISIHAPREGCDRRLADIDKAYDVFQSTHPVRGATATR